jgi:hypothetical protein
VARKSRSNRDLVTPPPVLSVVIPVALLFAAIAILAGLVFGGVLQGTEKREGPVDLPTAPSTIIIEP